jgi:hypothetical protein
MYEALENVPEPPGSERTPSPTDPSSASPPEPTRSPEGSGAAQDAQGASTLEEGSAPSGDRGGPAGPSAQGSTLGPLEEEAVHVGIVGAADEEGLAGALEACPRGGLVERHIVAVLVRLCQLAGRPGAPRQKRGPGGLVETILQRLEQEARCKTRGFSPDQLGITLR